MEVLRGPFLSFNLISLYLTVTGMRCSTCDASVNSTTATAVANVWSSRGEYIILFLDRNTPFLVVLTQNVTR